MANTSIPLNISLEDVGLGKAYNLRDYNGMSVKDVFNSLSDEDKYTVYKALGEVIDGNVKDGFAIANALYSKVLPHQWNVVRYLVLKCYDDYRKGDFI